MLAETFANCPLRFLSVEWTDSALSDIGIGLLDQMS
jgi:hypothetical protein